jgi:hypothetical protein
VDFSGKKSEIAVFFREFLLHLLRKHTICLARVSKKNASKSSLCNALIQALPQIEVSLPTSMKSKAN